MKVNPNFIEFNTENKKIVRPRSSSNKFNINNINKLIKEMDFTNIKNAKNLIESKEKLINFIKREQKIQNIIITKNVKANNFMQDNSSRNYLIEFEESKKALSDDQKRIKILEEKIKEKQKIVEQKNNQIKNVKDNISKMNESIKTKNENIEKMMKELDDFRKQNEDLEKKINDIAEELDEAGGLDLSGSLSVGQPNVDEMTYEQLLELEEQMGSVANGLTEEEIKNLKYDKYVKDKYSEDKCIICQYNFIELESIVGLPCKHFFHFNCLKPWVDKQHYCPLCKTNIRKEDEK
jgi:chromosome segregation ATPase